MIPAVCSICADYFEADHTVVTSQCGHVFHEHCLLQWLENSKTCPQCRRRTTDRNLIRLFFEVQEEEDGQFDPTRLKNQMGELQAEINRRKKEHADLLKDNAAYSERLENISKNTKKLTKKLSDEQSTNEALKKQLSVMSYRMDEAKEAKKESKRLREKLQFFERFDAVINRNAEMVEGMMREFGDGPRAAKELATYCASLKKEFENIKDSRKQLKEENAQLKKDLNHKTRTLDVRTRDVDALQQSVVSLQDDVQSLETEKQELRQRLERMQTALSSQGGDRSTPFKQAMCITPMNMNKKPRLSIPDDGDDIILDPGNPQTPDLVVAPSPSLKTRTTCNELGIPFVKTTSLANKKKKNEGGLSEAAIWQTTLASSSLFNQRRPQPAKGAVRKGYDGMGGHDTFNPISPIVVRPNMKKGPRGLKRKPSSKPCTQPLPTMDKFVF